MIPETPWGRAQLALRLLALDPFGLGGVWLKTRTGPVRDQWLRGLSALPYATRKLHNAISDDQLFGGIDLGATLAAGREVRSVGLLDQSATLVLPMAERCEPGLAARLAQALDTKTGHCLIAMDEAANADEGLPPALRDRLAFHIDLEEIAYGEATADLSPRGQPPETQPNLPEYAAAQIIALCAKLGIEGLRAPLFAMRCARANAALNNRKTVSTEDLEVAVALILAPRATQLPADDTEEPDQPQPEPTQDQTQDQGEAETEQLIPDEMLLEAALAVLPPDLLANLAGQKANRSAKGSGSGSKRTGNRRGRPLPSRAGRMDGRARVDLVATLRSAAPWQPMRKALSPRGQNVQVRSSDIRLKRYQEMSDRLLIFTVDASGSAALARLAEAKGAIELLLAEAYARRDHVSLVAFRGEDAELLLPPTRSLVQTKRRLAALPGGGGTPLASGIKTAIEQALVAKGRGLTPTIVLLTDGRANIALSGDANRAEAGSDATAMARQAWGQGIPALVIDVSKRPERSLQALAQVMDAPYIPLPRADAKKVSKAVTAALD
ncbi:magnesium chelatase subunit D [Shimia ponticola]|uniref:magnesium chelatase subunit D n=1 Tax=Shimia ponticola TaxID=2582893 RepID=UPI0011BEFE58|nr:magnesium chelatase subunit D [Shimia ponticola]